MSIKKLLVAINAKYIHSNPAVYSLRAYAKRASYCIEETDIAEYTINNRIEDIIDDIYVRKPNMLAFSCYIWNIEYVCKIMVEINKLLPHCHIWLGGPEVSYNTDYYLDKYKFIQGIMAGEGEETFSELAILYDSEADRELFKCKLNNIAGIATQEKRVVTEREHIDMSDIPFLYEELEAFENRIIYYESSRGCPYSCSYCLSCIDKKLRFRNMGLVEKELGFFLEHRVKQVKFIDRTFNCNRDRAIAIWKYISDNDNGVTNFHFEISSDLLDDEQINILKDMRPGLVQLEIGVQSTNEATLSAIRRRMNIHKLKTSVERLVEKGNMHIHLDLIAGLPYEDLQSFKQSFNDVYKMRPDELQLGFLKVLHGSYMYDDAKEYGIVYKAFPPYEVMYTQWMSYDDILVLKRIEEVLEIYYGSGQFVYCMRYLENFFATPYDLYCALGEFYDAGHICGSKHSRLERYNILLEFARSMNRKYELEADDTSKMTSHINEEILAELMTLDAYLRENCKSRPEFAKCLEAYRSDIKEMARALNIDKADHIEVFSKRALYFASDILPELGGDESMDNPDAYDKEVYVRFDYGNRNPVTHSATVHIFK